ncbi:MULTISPECIES: hypothetical protein [Deinococcus]|uniref:Uncharacterized protein n=2 Tax=Deinococcus TaxID=1298 RepID=A0A7W8GII4_9DEIO|nr:hypothetical protein [Deinococcus budaensis]MBB5235964.1 hypothetical protein [Deinococcus budaensis]
MAYKKLSEQMQELSNPQRSDAFVRQFRDAVREGKIDAMYLPERFTMPKEFRRRGAEGSYQRDARDMLFEVTPDAEQWFEQTNTDLAAPSRRSGTPKPTAENIEAGLVDFRALAEETRRKMQASYEKGQALGQSRSQAAKGKRAKAATGTRKTARRK